MILSKFCDTLFQWKISKDPLYFFESIFAGIDAAQEISHIWCWKLVFVMELTEL